MKGSVFLGLGLLLGVSTQAYAMEVFKVNSAGTAVITLTDADVTSTLSPNLRQRKNKWALSFI